MSLILIKSDSRFPIDRKRIKWVVEETLKKKKVSSPVEVSLFFVSGRCMQAINKKWRGQDQPTTVLAFSQYNDCEVRQQVGPKLEPKARVAQSRIETRRSDHRSEGGDELEAKRAGGKTFSTPEKKGLVLGDILVCYEQAQKLAQKEGRLVDETIDFLVEHGLRHLLGEHHPD